MNPAVNSHHAAALQHASRRTDAASGDQAASLRRHLSQCNAAHGTFFVAVLIAQKFHRLVAPRFVTTVTGVSVLLLIICGAG